MENKINRVAVVGTGTLGSQIATLSACFGYEVSAYDSDGGAFERALKDIGSLIGTRGKDPVVTVAEWDKGAEKVVVCGELKEALRDADLVIEAAPEDVAIKREVFKRLDALAPEKAILATNSSSIPISRIEDATNRPEKCLNLHFYFPALGHNMVDIMGGTKTTDETFQTGRAWIRTVGCVPLTVNKEILGFCFNRVWRAIKREVLHMWAEGFVDLRDIDRAWMIFSNMSQGPFGLMDNVGLDVIYDIEMVYYNESKDPKDHPPEALKAMIDRNELGRKTGKGFYTYPDPEYSKPDFLEA